MPCHSERNHSRLIARPSMLALLACIGLVLTPLRLAHANEATEPNIILEADVTAAVDKIRADPNLVPTQRVRVLRWVRGEKQERPAWHEWLRDFFRWVAESSRVLTWLGIAAAVALLVFYLACLVATFDRTRNDRPASTVPTHVRNLDIRPESLPEDIGTAAWALWEQGDRRGTLSLLYRGLLSRLVHEHAVPIRDSSTEGECLTLARKCLPAERSGYVERLILIWQSAVYGNVQPQNADVHSLCKEFSSALAVSARPAEART